MQTDIANNWTIFHFYRFRLNNLSGDSLVNGTNVADNSFVPAVYVWCRKWSDSQAHRHPLAAVSASSVGSLANHSLCNCEAVLRQYGGGRLLVQSITMRRVYWPDNQQTQLLPRLRRPSKWELRSASLRMILRSGSVTFPRASPPVGDPTTSISATSLSRKCLYSADTAARPSALNDTRDRKAVRICSLIVRVYRFARSNHSDMIFHSAVYMA